ncbi:MAG: 2-C-methyl-D-erythritol 4-phosphate cytidylyltransferase [Dorea sp.]|nr:2-C-methyl-D-erythritol 4-phosphate cytidylyltransferase [Dorea sp.]MDY2813222.1 2-C-methyl-D-erythritol 4-phosphate cytidylyltransferase [Dorea sp.]
MAGKKSEKKHCTAIILSAGQGKRMGTSVQKQYLEIQGKPVIYYSLKAFEDSGIIDDVILVVGHGQEDYVYDEIVRKYGLAKVRAIVPGGKERYDSVWQGLKIIQNGALSEAAKNGYVYIHDGARPFVDEEIIERAYITVNMYRACVAGVPSKDTIKIVDEDGFAVNTPDRRLVWNVQTPQVFETGLITEAYFRMMQKKSIQVTDDAMAVEQEMNVPVKLFEGSYRNIKITTPEDLETANSFLKKK